MKPSPKSGLRTRDGAGDVREGYRADIDGLRALAVGLVVAFHFGVERLSGGYVGVDVFFVISGFLITGLIEADLRRGTFGFVRFWTRRARRILPASLVMTLIVAAVFAAVYPPHLYRELCQSSIAQLLFVANVHFWIDADYFSNAAELKPLLHTWSLSVEEQFYLLFPALLLLCHRVAPRRTLFATLVVTGLACTASLVVSVWLSARSPASAFYLLPARGWELGAGALLALMLPRMPRTNTTVAFASASVGLALVLYAALHFDAATPFPSWRAMLPVLGTVLILIGNRDGAHPLSRLFSSRPLVLLGLLSYSIYLWHWPVAVLARWFELPMSDARVTFGAILSVLVLAGLSWRFVEQPVRTDRVRFGDRRVLSGCAACIVIGLGIGSLGATVGNGRLVDPDGAVAAFQKAAFEPVPGKEQCTDLYRRGGESVSCMRDNNPALDAPTLFLWGDSHAGALLPGVEAAARELGIDFEFSITNGCQAVTGMRRVDADVGCASTSEAVLRRIEATRPALVLLVSSFVKNVTEGNLRDLDAARATDPARAIPEFERRFAATVRRLRDTGARVVVFTEPPRHERNPVTDGVKRLLRGERLETVSPSLDRAAHERRIADIYGAIDRAEADRRLDYADAFCDAEHCAALAAGQPLYQDASHLTPLGARRLANRLGRDIAGELAARR